MQREQLHAAFATAFADGGIAPITSESLGEVEGMFQTMFPTSYLEFATKVGSISTPAVLELVTGGNSEIAPPGASFDVQNFFDAKEIIETTRDYRAAGMKSWMIAVASDCMGNVFGFRQQDAPPRLDDAPLYLFDHDFCKIHNEAVNFDTWISSFLAMKAFTESARHETPP